MRRFVVGAMIAGASLAATKPASALTVQEAILRATPAVVLVTSEVGAEVTMNCGTGPVTIQTAPFIETGTGWFIDGRGYLVTNAHVVEPAYRQPPWVAHELKKKAIEQACVDPELKARGLMPGQRPDLEERIRREASQRALETAKLTSSPQITVLFGGKKIPAEVKKFSPPASLDATGQPTKDFGRDLALLQVKDGAYPALSLTGRAVNVGDSVHILGFPGVVMSHELLNRSVQASVTSGTASAFQKDAIGQDMIQTDASAAHGNSGGPAITNDGTVIGVLTAVTLAGSSGSIVQGFNFLIPAKDVSTFLAGTPAIPGQSRFNDVWYAGLAAYFEGGYAAAVARMEEADGLAPNLATVKRMLEDARDKVKHPPPRPFPWAWATLGVTLLSGGAFGGMWGRRWWKGRFRILPAQVIALIEKGQSPVMVDVRTPAEFDTSPFKLPGAVRLAPDDAAAGRIQLQVDPTQTIVTYCTSPDEATSERVSYILLKRGYRNVRILKGGLGGWTNARLPVETKSHMPSIGIELYKNLSLGDVARRRVPANEPIFREGDDAHGEAFVVHAGGVEIRRRFNGNERVLRKVSEGEIFGEFALFRGAPRSADAVATAESELLVITYDRLDWLIRNRPQLTMEVLKQLSNFVVETDNERPQR